MIYYENYFKTCLYLSKSDGYNHVFTHKAEI